MKICIDLTINETYTGIGQVANKYLKELENLESTRIIKYGKKNSGEFDFEFSSYYNLYAHFRFYLFLLKLKPDAIIIPHYFIPFFIPSKIKIYSVVHDVMAIKNSDVFFGSFSKIKSLILLMLLKYNFCCRKNITIITPSYSVSYDVKKMFNKKTIVIPNGQFELNNRKSKKKENYFLYIGNARKHKNQLSLFAFFNSQEFSKLKVVSEIFPIPIFRNIEFLGKLNSKNEIVELLEKSRGVIMPSFCEGFGLPIIESLLFSGKAYSSDIEVFKEFYGLNIDYFDPNNLSQLMLTLNPVPQIIPRSTMEISNLFKWQELKYFFKNEFL